MKKTLSNKDLDRIPAEMARTGESKRVIMSRMLAPNAVNTKEVKKPLNKKKN